MSKRARKTRPASLAADPSGSPQPEQQAAPSGTRSRPRRYSRLFLLLVGVLGIAGWIWWALQPRTRGPVILISVDTLRADHLPLYGYGKVKTPFLDALAADSVVFDNAVSHVPLTLPAHTSMMTGLLPFEHGVRDNIGFRLDPKHHTLAQALKKAGYTTGAAVSAFVLRAETGINAGFDWFEDDLMKKAPRFSIAEVQRDGSETVDAALNWLRGHSDKPDLFLFLHLYDPHKPYRPPDRFQKQYPDNLYDGEIAYSDELVGRVLDELKKLGLYQSSLIVLLSDHGEGLGDHDEDEHGVFLYRSVLHVPLIVKLPDSEQAGTRIAAPVQQVDLYPTLLDWLGLEPQPASGHSLVPLMLGAQPGKPREIYSETLYPRYHFGWKELYALTGDRFSYILAPKAELYDFKVDPGQLHNLLPPQGPAVEVHSRYRDVLQAYVQEAPLVAPESVSEEDQERMQALGYVGAPILSAENEANLADPKDRIGDLDRYRKAIRLKFDRRFKEAVTEMRALLQDSPQMVDVWDQLAEILSRMGKTQEAIDALKQSLTLVPNRPDMLLVMADLLFRMQRDEEAFQHLELARSKSPGKGGLALAMALLRRDRGEEARAAALSASEELPAAKPFVEAVLLHKARRFDEALPRLKEAETLAEKMPGTYLKGLDFYLADVLARNGQEKDAEQHFQRELRLNPSNVEALFKLCALYRSQERIAELDEIMNRYGQENPSTETYKVLAETYRVFGLQQQEAVWQARAAESSQP